MGKFIFDSTGGCPRCDNMDGEYDEKPTRPHPYCDCEIYAADVESECYSLQKGRHGITSVLDEGSDPALLEVEVEFGFDVICHHQATEHSETVIFTRDLLIPLSDRDKVFDYMDEVAADLLDVFDMHVEIRAHELCECDENDNFV